MTMAYSYEQYEGDGATREYALTFDYLSRDHIEVRVDGVLKTVTTHYIFLTASTIQFTVAETPEDEALVEVRRNTPKDAPFVDYSDGAALHENDLDNGLLSVLYIAQEAFDASDTEDLTAAFDAVLAAAAAARDAALAAQVAAELAETNAETAETNAETAETNAETAETNAETAQAAAEAARNKAEDWADEAEDVPVETGPDRFSAKHWAAKAEDLGNPRIDFNFTFNGDFEIWGAGASADPTGWQLNGAGASAARDATNKKISAASVSLTRSGADLTLSQSIAALFHTAPWWMGKTITIGCWVRCAVASRARLLLFMDGSGGSGSVNSPYHTGGGGWEFLTATAVVSTSGLTTLGFNCVIDTGDTSAQFDGAIVVVGSSVSDFIPSGWRGRKSQIFFHGSATQAAGATHYYGFGNTTTEGNNGFVTGMAFVARKLYTQVPASAGVGETFTYTLRKDAADTALTCVAANVTEATDSDPTHEVVFGIGQHLALKVVTSGGAAATIHRGVIEVEEVPA